MAIVLHRFIEKSWINFLEVLREDILPIYENHENTFDYNSMHGRMHICRCLIFGEFMCRYYHQETSMTPKVESIRYAIAFHDSGRQENGIDRWEQDSAQKCAHYLVSHPTISVQSHETTSNLITKEGRGDWGIEKRIVHDADVLDIMRPCCGHGGRTGFKEKVLRFLGSRDYDTKIDYNLYIRNQLIEECWIFINRTEEEKMNLNKSSDYIGDVIDILETTREECPLLSKYILRW